MSMLASYFQRQIPPGALLVGELDLFQNIRPISDAHCQSLLQVLVPGEESPLARHVRELYISGTNEGDLGGLFNEADLNITIHGVEGLEAMIRVLWPDIMD